MLNAGGALFKQAIPPDRLGEQVACAIIAAEEVSEKELESFLRERVARTKIPTAYVFLEVFPMTGSGKVRKFKLAEMLTS